MNTPAERARDLITFADGIQEGGFPEIARRCRIVASDVLELADQLDAERSARHAIQADRDRIRDLLTARALGGVLVD